MLASASRLRQSHSIRCNSKVDMYKKQWPTSGLTATFPFLVLEVDNDILLGAQVVPVYRPKKKKVVPVPQEFQARKFNVFHLIPYHNLLAG